MRFSPLSAPPQPAVRQSKLSNDSEECKPVNKLKKAVSESGDSGLQSDASSVRSSSLVSSCSSGIDELLVEELARRRLNVDGQGHDRREEPPPNRQQGRVLGARCGARVRGGPADQEGHDRVQALGCAHARLACECVGECPRSAATSR